MNMNEALTSLALDLKVTIGTEVSVAEGERCIEKAVDVLSRKLPRERIYEHTWIKDVTDDSFTTPAALDTDGILTSWDLSAVVDGDNSAPTLAWLDVPRPVTILVTDANDSILRFTLIITGTDADGVSRKEKFYRHDGKSQTGKIYFSSISDIEFNEIAGNGAADTLIVGWGSGFDVWTQLTNPVESGSESIYSAASKAGTKYTLDTDYTMDYANGRIKILSAGSMVEATTYYSNYSRASTSVDISEIIPYLIRLNKVRYPVDTVPEQLVAFTIWENMLTIASPRQGVSQETLTDKEHLAIYYEAKHAPPTYVGSGSYPDMLDDVVLLGAAGYALEIEALQYEFQAVTDLAAVRTELGLTTAIHTLVAAALAKVSTYATDMNTALDAAIVQAAAAATALDKINSDATRTYLTDADASLDLAAVALVKVITYQESNTSEDSKYWLTKITTDIADIRTKVLTSQTAAATYLGKVSTVDLDAATPDSAIEALKKYEDLINQLNDGGSTVGAVGAEYSRAWANIGTTRLNAALGYTQEAASRLANLQSYINQADGWGRIAERFIGEAGQHIAEAAARMSIADRYLTEASERTDSANSYIAEANGRFSMVQSFIGEANTEIAEIVQHIAEAGQWQTAADSDMVLSDRFRAEAMNRLAEFNRTLEHKAEYRKRIISTPMKQPG